MHCGQFTDALLSYLLCSANIRAVQDLPTHPFALNPGQNQFNVLLDIARQIVEKE